MVDVLFEHAAILEPLVALGWNEADARNALVQNAWDRDRAEIQLKEVKHRKQCQYPGQDGFQRRIEKILRKQHSACLAEVGTPCICKTVEAKSFPAVPVVPLVGVASDAPEVEEFSGAFATPKRPEFACKHLFPSAQRNVPPALEDNAAGAQGELEKDGDEGFIVVRGRRRFWPEIEQAQAEDSGSNESLLSAKCADNVHEVDAELPSECGISGSSGSNHADSLFEALSDSLLEELPGEIPRSRAARKGRAYARLRRQHRLEPESFKKAEENEDDSHDDPYGMMPSDEEEQDVCSAGCSDNADPFAEEFSGAFAKLGRG